MFVSGGEELSCLPDWVQGVRALASLFQAFRLQVSHAEFCHLTRIRTAATPTTMADEVHALSNAVHALSLAQEENHKQQSPPPRPTLPLPRELRDKIYSYLLSHQHVHGEPYKCQAEEVTSVWVRMIFHEPRTTRSLAEYQSIAVEEELSERQHCTHFQVPYERPGYQSSDFQRSHGSADIQQLRGRVIQMAVPR